MQTKVIQPRALAAPLSGAGRGLKLMRSELPTLLASAAPLSGAGRGLKQRLPRKVVAQGHGRPALRSGARIETLMPKPQKKRTGPPRSQERGAD